VYDCVYGIDTLTELAYLVITVIMPGAWITRISYWQLKYFIDIRNVTEVFVTILHILVEPNKGENHPKWFVSPVTK
jgi:hypothetical protein